MSDGFCPECKRATEVVFDHSAGDTVCSECGLVLESHSIDETSEWRTFANEAGDNDPVRVGGPTNPLLADGGLSTVIAKPNGGHGDFLSSSLSRWQNRGSNPDRSLIAAFKAIATMVERLGASSMIKSLRKDIELESFLSCMLYGYKFVLFAAHADISDGNLISLCIEERISMQCVTLGSLKSIQDRANEVYKRVEDLKSIRGRNQDAILAACLYIACRQEANPRTVKEICSVANGATKKEIVRAKEFIVKQLEREMGESIEMGSVNAEQLVRRFSLRLGMNIHSVTAAEAAVQKSEELDIRRSPISITAAIIYMISQLSPNKIPLKVISDNTGVAEGTIRNSYKDLYPYASRLIPASFAKGEDLKNLCSP